MLLVDKLTGAKSPNIIIGPKPGVDVSVIRIDHRSVMICSSDPVSLIPSLGPRLSARMSVYEVASDLATSGVPPRYAMVDLNLPPELADRTLEAYWKAFHETCLELGISIVGGHTGRFEGCDYSVIGGATLWATCNDDEYVTSTMAEDGDEIVLTKSAGYGATSVLTRAFPKTVEKAIGPTLFESAWGYFHTSNTVKDSLVAAKAGLHERGVTAMHDCTEGGVVAGLIELATASRLGGTIDVDNIEVSEESREVCKFFRMEPMVSLGEGSLIITCNPKNTDKIMSKLASGGIQSRIVGRLTSRFQGCKANTGKGTRPLSYPRVDPYWKAYSAGIRKGWS